MSFMRYQSAWDGTEKGMECADSIHTLTCFSGVYYSEKSNSAFPGKRSDTDSTVQNSDFTDGS